MKHRVVHNIQKKKTEKNACYVLSLTFGSALLPGWGVHANIKVNLQVPIAKTAEHEPRKKMTNLCKR
jgi:hypothetical protein